MELNKFLNKTDIQLYRGILNKIFKDFDTIEPHVLGELLDKLKELHQNLDNIVKQKQTQSMYNTPYNNKINQLQKKKDKEDLEQMRNREEWFECVKSDGMLLSDIYRVIKKK
jgi:regulator of replication initiation timing